MTCSRQVKLGHGPELPEAKATLCYFDWGNSTLVDTVQQVNGYYFARWDHSHTHGMCVH